MNENMDNIQNKNHPEINQKKKVESFSKNTKVFILPPELLTQLGINIESYQNNEQSVTKEKEDESTNLSQIKKCLKDKLTDKINKKNQAEQNIPEPINVSPKSDNLVAHEKNNHDCFRTPKVPARYKKSHSQMPTVNSNSISESTNLSYNLNEADKNVTHISNLNNVASNENSPNLSRSDNELNFSPSYLEHLEKAFEPDIQANLELTDSELAVLNSPTLTTLDCQTFDDQKDSSSLISEDNFSQMYVSQSSSEYTEILNSETIDSVSNVTIPDNYIPKEITSNISLPSFQSVIAKTNQIPVYFYDQSTGYSKTDVSNENIINENSVIYETCQLENDNDEQVTEIIVDKIIEKSQVITNNSTDKEQEKTNSDSKKNECFLELVEHFKVIQERKLNSPNYDICKKIVEPKKSSQTLNDENELNKSVNQINYKQYQYENEPSTSKTVIETDDEPILELRLNSPNFGQFDNDTYIFTDEKNSITNEIPTITDEIISKIDQELNNIECSIINTSLFEDSVEENNSSGDENACLNREFILFQKNLKFHQNNIKMRKIGKKFAASTPNRKNDSKNKLVQSICSDFVSDSDNENDEKNANRQNLPPSANLNILSNIVLHSEKNTSEGNHCTDKFSSDKKALESNINPNKPLETETHLNKIKNTNVDCGNSKESPDTNRSKRRISRSSRYSNDFFVCPTPKRRTSRNAAVTITNDQNIIEDEPNNQIEEIITENIVKSVKDDEILPSENKFENDIALLPPKKKFGRRNLNKKSLKDQEVPAKSLLKNSEDKEPNVQDMIQNETSQDSETIIAREPDVLDSVLDENSQMNSIACEFEGEQTQEVKLTERKKRGRKRNTTTKALNIEPTQPKRRSSRRKNNDNITLENEIENTSLTLETSAISDEDDKPLIKPKRSQKRKYPLNEEKSSDPETNDSVSSMNTSIINDEDDKPLVKPKRGRKPKVPDTKNSALSGDSVVCAVCSAECKRSTWTTHAKKHNFLTWKVGEPPIDLENDRDVAIILSKRKSSLKKLVCEKCSISRISAMGFIAHIRSCGKSEEEMKKYLVECSLCNEMINKYSLQGHMSHHKVLQRKEAKNESLNEEPALENPLPSKRLAAQRAIKTFKDAENDDDQYNEWYSKLNKRLLIPMKQGWQKMIEKFSKMDCVRRCGFSADNLEKMVEHFQVDCPYINWLKCKICSEAFSTNEIIIEHLTKTHDNVINKKHDLESSSSSSEESVAVLEQSIKPPEDMKIYEWKKVPKFENHYQQLARDFVKLHFSSEILFEDMQCKKFIKVLKKQISLYLPEKKKSCNFAFAIYKPAIEKTPQSQLKWKKFQLFESEIHRGVQSFWCGGYIRSLAWTPSEDETDTFLAVAVDKSRDQKYSESKLYSHNNTLQIWNCGNLSGASQCDSPATLSMIIAHSYGVIWDMVWCPSGCYDKSKEEDKKLIKRIGLLALACSNGFVHIIAICDPNNFSNCSQSESKFFKTEPVATLRLYNTDDTSLMLNGIPCYPTKIVWNQEKNHKMIIVGYSNGYVGFFDLTTTSPLLKHRKDNIEFFYPYNILHAHNTAIIGLSLLPRTESLIKKSHEVILCTVCITECSVWYGEQLLRQRTGNFSSSITSQFYPQFILSSNDLVTNLCRTHSSRLIGMTIKKPVWNDLSLVSSADVCLLGPSYACGCLWCGSIINVEPGGDIAATREKHCFISQYRNKKPKSSRVIITYPLLYALNNEPIKSNCKMVGQKKNFLDECVVLENYKKDAFTYDEVIENYGVLHVDVDYNMHDDVKMNKNLTVKSPPLNHLSIDRYPIQTVSCVTVNPSETKHKFVAYGGPSGLVRIMHHTMHPSLLDEL